MTLSRKEMVKKAALDVLKAFIIGVAAAAAAAHHFICMWISLWQFSDSKRL